MAGRVIPAVCGLPSPPLSRPSRRLPRMSPSQLGTPPFGLGAVPLGFRGMCLLLRLAPACLGWHVWAEWGQSPPAGLSVVVGRSNLWLDVAV